MFVWLYIEWWYGPGWRDLINRLGRRVNRVFADFSVSIILRTLFAPWRRTITDSGHGLPQQLRAIVDNLVSRWVGLSVRLLALAAALIIVTINVILGLALVIIWPLLPVAGLALIGWGLAR